MRDVTVTAAGAIAIVNRGSENPANTWIRRGGREFRRTPVLFPEVSRVVIAQPVIDRQIAPYFPGILRINSQLLLSHAGICRIIDAHLVNQAKQKTRVDEPDVGPANSRILKWLARFSRVESINACRISVHFGRITLSTELRAELISVVLLDP